MWRLQTPDAPKRATRLAQTPSLPSPVGPVDTGWCARRSPQRCTRTSRCRRLGRNPTGGFFSSRNPTRGRRWSGGWQRRQGDRRRRLEDNQTDSKSSHGGRKILRLGLDSRRWDWMTEITGGWSHVRRGERRRLGRGRRTSGDEIAQSGRGVNASLREIDRSRRNLNTGGELAVRVVTVIGQLDNLQSRAQRNGAERGIRDARTWKR